VLRVVTVPAGARALPAGAAQRLDARQLGLQRRRVPRQARARPGGRDPVQALPAAAARRGRVFAPRSRMARGRRRLEALKRAAAGILPLAMPTSAPRFPSLVTLALLALVFAFWWFGAGTLWRSSHWAHYIYLADAFLHGQLHLARVPDDAGDMAQVGRRL